MAKIRESHYPSRIGRFTRRKACTGWWAESRPFRPGGDSSALLKTAAHTAVGRGPGGRRGSQLPVARFQRQHQDWCCRIPRQRIGALRASPFGSPKKTWK